MTELQKLVNVMTKLEKCGITFDSKLKFMCQFSTAESPKVIINSLKRLCKYMYIGVHVGGYPRDSREIGSFLGKKLDLPLICDLVYIGKNLKVNEKLKYAFTYKIWCSICGRLQYVTVNCASSKVPRICEDCTDKLIDQSS